MFTAKNIRVPERAKGKHYVGNAVAFMKSVGYEALQEAERLQDINVSALCGKIQAFTSSLQINLKMVSCVSLCCLASVTFHFVHC